MAVQHIIALTWSQIYLFNTNYLLPRHTQVADVGGSMFIHTFGAYFGLAVARVVYTKDAKDSDNEGSSYHGDLFSMIGK